MRKSGPKRFTDEFRREAVRLIRESDRPMKDAAVELGGSVTTLRKWERTVALQKPGPGRVLSLEEQVRQLKRENERLREEREIPKKATAFFAKERR
jgi:transposase